nr:exodeoxyribonuclease V subunit gamma [Neisseria sp. HSC-16F19]
MLFLYQSNRLEHLAAMLAAVYRQDSGAGLWAAEEIVVQSQGIRRYLNRYLAQELGIAAHIRYSLPAGLAWQLLRRVAPETPRLNPFHTEVLRWRLLDIFGSEAFTEPQWAPVAAALQPYLHSSANAPYRLAGQLADMFDQYLVYRPQWIKSWQQGRLEGLGDDEAWQAALWRALDDGSAPHRVMQWDILTQGLRAEHLPRRLLVFGMAALAPAYLDLLHTAARHCDVHIFALNPSAEAWGSIRSADYLLERGLTAPEDVGHPLLASLGKQGRDFFDALAALPDVQIELPVFDALPEQPTLLQRLQDDIQHLRLPEKRYRTADTASENGQSELFAAESECIGPVAADHSIQIQSAHSPVRELHILKAQLWRDLHAHPHWQPHDIAVLTPHIEPYLPFIDAVFGQAQPGSPALPYSLADVKISRQQPLLQLLEAWLTLVQGRLETDSVLPLLDSPLIRQRFDLHDADVALIQAAVAEQGVRWGSGADMRAHYGGSGDAFTWDKAHTRTVLGWLLPQTADAPLWQGVLPWFADLGHTPALARALAWLQTVLRHYPRWQSPATAAEWVTRLHDWLADMTDEAERGSAAMQQLEQSLADWTAHTELADFTQALPPATALEHMQGLLSQRSEAGFLRGGITFCSMVPMRSLPFKCLCLIGLNDGAYPRTTKAAAFDLIQHHPLPGDRARRDDDRYLFLESLLSAREKLYLSYVGRDIRKNEALAPSALVNELTDTLAVMTATPAADWVSEHPLQPFSRRYFDGTLPGSRSDYAAALNEESAGLPFGSQIGTEAPAQMQVSVAEWLQFWHNPVRQWLQKQLGWRDYRAAEVWDTAEPFAPEDEAPLLAAYLDARRHHRDFAAAETALQQSNALPDGLLGDCFRQPARAAVLALDGDLLASPKQADIPVDFSAAGVTLTGSLGDIHAAGRMVYLHQKINAPQRITLWLQHLLLCACAPEGTDTRTHLIYPKQPETLPALPRDEAAALLAPWLDYYRLGQNHALPFFAKVAVETGAEWAKNPPADDSTEPPLNVRQKAHSSYIGNERSPGMAERHEVAQVFGRDADTPVESPLFWHLIRDLILPLQQAFAAQQADT